MIPDPSKIAEALDGTEVIRIMQHGRWRWLLTEKLLGFRIETVTAKVVGAAGVVTLAFPKPFKSPPAVLPTNVSVVRQVYLGVVTSATTTGAVVTLMRSRGTLLLSEGPFEFAPAGTAVSAVVIGS